MLPLLLISFFFFCVLLFLSKVKQSSSRRNLGRDLRYVFCFVSLRNNSGHPGFVLAPEVIVYPGKRKMELGKSAVPELSCHLCEENCHNV